MTLVVLLLTGMVSDMIPGKSTDVRTRDATMRWLENAAGVPDIRRLSVRRRATDPPHSRQPVRYGLHLPIADRVSHACIGRALVLLGDLVVGGQLG
jgi:hypothetical protein